MNLDLIVKIIFIVFPNIVNFNKFDGELVFNFFPARVGLGIRLGFGQAQVSTRVGPGTGIS